MLKALEIFYSLLAVSLFVPILAGLYVRRAGTREALASIFAGISTMITVYRIGDSGAQSVWGDEIARLEKVNGGVFHSSPSAGWTSMSLSMSLQFHM